MGHTKSKDDMIKTSIELQDLRKKIYIKAKAEKMSYASGGAGSPGHLTTELFLATAGLEIVGHMLGFVGPRDDGGHGLVRQQELEEELRPGLRVELGGPVIGFVGAGAGSHGAQVVHDVARGEQEHVEREPDLVAADLHVALFEHVQQTDLDPLGEVGELVDREDPAVGARHQPVVQGELVGEVAALGDLDRIDLADLDSEAAHHWTARVTGKQHTLLHRDTTPLLLDGGRTIAGGETFEIADHVVVLANGAVAAQGSPAQLRASTDPLIHQFVHALSDGPVPFHYPAPAAAQDYDGSPA